MVSDFCQNTFAGGVLGRSTVMWCVLVAEIVDKPLAVSAFPGNSIYLTGPVVPENSIRPDSRGEAESAHHCI